MPPSLSYVVQHVKTPMQDNISSCHLGCNVVRPFLFKALLLCVDFIMLRDGLKCCKCFSIVLPPLFFLLCLITTRRILKVVTIYIDYTFCCLCFCGNASHFVSRLYSSSPLFIFGCAIEFGNDEN